MARHSKDEVETLIREWVEGVYNIFPLFRRELTVAEPYRKSRGLQSCTSQ